MSKLLNMQFIKRSRLKTGDIFAVLLSDNKYIFGRIIDSTLPMMGSTVSLVYIYNVRSQSIEPDLVSLTPNNILIPPVITFSNLWTQGYAVKVGREKIRNEDLIPHVFFNSGNGKYLDEYGNEISKPKENILCGAYGILGIGIIDDKISDALNIKRAPLAEEDIWYISGKGEKIWLKQTDSELKKYANYKWIVKNYPEVVE